MTNNEFEDFLHGNCHQWVINNFQKGDTILVLQEYDYFIDEECMAHALLLRNGKYLDVRGFMDDMDEVLEEFDCTDDDCLEFKTLKEFTKYLDNMDIPYVLPEKGKKKKAVKESYFSDTTIDDEENTKINQEEIKKEDTFQMTIT